METQSSSPQKDFWSFTAKTAGDQKKDQYQIRSIKKQESEVSKNTCQSPACFSSIQQIKHLTFLVLEKRLVLGISSLQLFHTGEVS